MATAKCEVNNRWMWSLESASIGITSPTGKSLWIQKIKFGNFNETDAMKAVVWKCAEAQNEIRLTAEEMILLKQVSDLHNGNQIDAHLFPKHKSNPIPQAPAVPKGPFIPAVQKSVPIANNVPYPAVQKHFAQNYVLDSTTLNPPTSSIAVPIPHTPAVTRRPFVPRPKSTAPVARKGPKPPVADCIKSGVCTCSAQLKMRDHGTWVGYHCTSCKTGGSFTKPKQP